MMHISMTGRGAEEELRSLRAWLLETPNVRQHSKISLESEPASSGEMGAGGLEILQLITDNFWQTTTFALSYVTWRKTRNRKPTVTIESNGRRIVIESNDEESAERIIQALNEE
ncbi:effector-associated constant component EACC1 [Streptomyces sp. IBSNAI001]|uniref:effector-associated constant component EACC1 n=1 Tax=Streptomyces sp. IBSNAI001 TaxID=3457499 RepID=UPI003FCFAD67